MGVLDKFRIRGTVKSRFNPGRNNNWDWNELLTTIEKNFEGDFDLAALQASVDTNTTNIASNTTKANTNTANITANAEAIAANAASITRLCAALNAAFEAAPLLETAAAEAFTS